MIDLTKTKVSEEYLRENKDSIDWDIVCEYQKLSEPFIEEFQNYVNWSKISRCQKLSEPFMEKHLNKLFSSIAQFQVLSEGFIKKYHKMWGFLWTDIFCFQKISEDFIREFQDMDFIKNSWDIIPSTQILSEDFIEEFAETINWTALSYGKWDLISEQFVEKHIDKFDLDRVWHFQSLSKSFIEKHVDKISPEVLVDNINNLKKAPSYIILKYMRYICEGCGDIFELKDSLTEEEFTLLKNCYEMLK